MVVVGPIVCQPPENGFSMREQIHIQILQSLQSIAQTLTEKVTQVKLDFETELVEVKETLQENNGLLGNLTTKMTENSGKIQQNQVSLQSSIAQTLTEKVTQVKADFETDLVKVKETVKENNDLLGNLKTKITKNSGKIQKNQVSLQSIGKTLTEKVKQDKVVFETDLVGVKGTLRQNNEILEELEKRSNLEIQCKKIGGNYKFLIGHCYYID